MKKTFRMMMAVAIAVLTFTACEDVPEPYNNPYDGRKPAEPAVVIEPAGSGTIADPYNVARALEVCAEVGEAGTADNVYTRGIITSITEVSTSYGNATFMISDDESGSNSLTIYRAYSVGNNKFTKDDEIKVGDEVLMCGKLVNFKNNTPEYTQGCYIYSLNGGGSGGGSDTPTTDDKAVGTKDAPKTVAEALTAINALDDGATTTEYWYVGGKVVKVTTTAANFEQYKNLNYLISADGTETNTITVYAGNGLDNALFSGIDALKAGDEVVVYGQLQKYVNKNTGAVTPEIAKGNYLVKYTAGGGSTPSSSGEAKGSGTLADPYNAIAANNKAGELAQGETSTESYYVKGKISQIKYTFSAQYGTATFNISEDGKTENEFYIYSTLYLGNKSWVDGDTQIAVGDEVVVYGQFTNYNGTLETASKKSYIYSLNGKTSDDGSGDNSGGSTETSGGVLDGNVLTVVYGDLGISSIDNPLTLVDGTTLTFSQEDGKNKPIYHESTKMVRMYAHNSVTINAGSKKIASVVFNYDTYQGTAYCGNDELYGEAGGNKLTPAKDDKTVSFTGVNASTLKVMNDLSSGNSGGVQFRCTGLVITYAE